MGKKNKSYNTYKNNKDISDIIVLDIIRAMEEDDNISTVIKSLPQLIELGQCKKMTGNSTLHDMSISTLLYSLICKFMIKHEKNFKRKIYKYPNKVDFPNEEISHLYNNRLLSGTYFINIDNYNYAILRSGLDEYEGYSDFEFYIIGDKCDFYMDKIKEENKKYEKIMKADSPDYMIAAPNYFDSKVTIFKPFEKLILKEKNEIISYIEKFQSNLDSYKKYALMPKLSIMAYGLPGTGKTTLARAIAKYFGIKKVVTFGQEFFSDNSPKENRKPLRFYEPGIILIDDIDCICNSRETDKSKENAATLQNLLQFLDNPPTMSYEYNGKNYDISIVIATTNYYDKLDPAIVRHGRFDKTYELGYLNYEEAKDMIENIFDLKVEDVLADKKIDIKKFSISPSEVQAKCVEKLTYKFKN